MAEPSNKKSNKNSVIRRPGMGSSSGMGGYRLVTKEQENAEKAEDRKIEKELKKESRQARKERKTTVAKRKSKETKKFHKDVKKKRRRVILAIIVLLVMILTVAFFGYFAYTYMIDNIKNPTSEDTIFIDDATSVKFRVEKKEDTKSISKRLYEMGLIKNEMTYRILSKFYGYDGTYNAGTYTLCTDLTYEEIMVILSGEPETVRVTFPEGFTTLQIAARLEANDVCTAEEFLNCVQTIDVSSYAFLQGTDLTKKDYRLDGYLFPDTYEFDVMAHPEDIIYKMLDRFNQIFKPAYYTRCEELGLTIDQVVTLASLVEKEAKLDSDRAPVAGVFYNRYNSTDTDMHKFQSDATVAYVYKKLYGEAPTKFTSEELAIDDPYNTYIYEGFMPGAICNPGLDSIEGALNPTDHGYYYFVYKKDGTGNIYSRTYEEHLHAVASQQ